MNQKIKSAVDDIRAAADLIKYESEKPVGKIRVKDIAHLFPYGAVIRKKTTIRSESYIYDDDHVLWMGNLLCGTRDNLRPINMPFMDEEVLLICNTYVCERASESGVTMKLTIYIK